MGRDRCGGPAPPGAAALTLDSASRVEWAVALRIRVPRLDNASQVLIV
jgi:hypothetical protein